LVVAVHLIASELVDPLVAGSPPVGCALVASVIAVDGLLSGPSVGCDGSLICLCGLGFVCGSICHF
jgi:hypothetical protein